MQAPLNFDHGAKNPQARNPRPARTTRNYDAKYETLDLLEDREVERARRAVAMTRTGYGIEYTIDRVWGI